MGAFKIEILGVGGHGCERMAKPGDQLYRRCGRFNCPDCVAFDFVQQLKSKGMLREGDTAQGQPVTHSPACPVVPECTCNAVPKDAEVYYTNAEGRTVGADGKPFTSLQTGGREFWQRKHKAEFTHWPGEPSQVVDDMLTNTRKAGSF